MKKNIVMLVLLSFASILHAADNSFTDEREQIIKSKIARTSTGSPNCLKRISSAQKLAEEMTNDASLASKEVSSFVRSVVALNVGHKSIWEHIDKLKAKPESEKSQQDEV